MSRLIRHLSFAAMTATLLACTVPDLDFKADAAITPDAGNPDPGMPDARSPDSPPPDAPDGSPITRFAVGGVVSGMDPGASVILRLTSGAIDEALAVAENGTFVFETRLEGGADYAVTVSGVPTGHGCALANAEGTVLDADVTTVEAFCAVPRLTTLSTTAPVSFAEAFEPTRTSYTLNTSILTQRLSVLATADERFTIAVDGATLPEEVTSSAPITLPLGTENIVVETTFAGVSTSYTLSVTRDEPGIDRTIFGKANNTSRSGFFGESVALSGDTMVVGAPDNNASGAKVYVLRRSGETWVEEAILTAPSSASLPKFGNAVAIDGNVVVVGAKRDGAGRAYVFRRTDGAWAQEAELVSSLTLADGDRFGSAVDISENVIVVGIPERSDGEGAAEVFRYNGATWTSEDVLTNDAAQTGDQFGYSVAVDGDRLAVGAPFEDESSTITNTGFVYTYFFAGTDWQLDERLNIGSRSGDHVGLDTDLSGSTLVVGAPGKIGLLGVSDAGAVIFFERTGSWERVGTFRGAREDELGHAVSIDGEMAAFCAPDEVDESGSGDAGGYCVLARWDGTEWTEISKILNDDLGGDLNDEFGKSGLAISGDSLVVGARTEDTAAGGFDPAPDDNLINAGAIYISH